MPLASLDRRTMLRYALCLTFVVLAPVSSAIGSETIAPIEQLHTGLIEIMKAGKVAPFRQRYDKIAPVILRAFDLEVIVRQVVGSRWTRYHPTNRLRCGTPFAAIPSRPTFPTLTPTLASASRFCPELPWSAMIES
jgi:hypothetical protein